MNRVYHLLFLISLSLFISTPGWSQGKSGVSPQVLVLPQGPGSLGGIGENVSANLNMGLMTYPIKIALPQGRQKHTPMLQVVYSSNAGSDIMGIGWNLEGAGAIERMTARGLPTYTNQDPIYAPDGELVQVPGTSVYRARFEGGFTRYHWRHSNEQDQKGHWIAEAPNGTKSYYGATADGTIDPFSQLSGSAGTFRWHLREKVDKSGNRITYHYKRVGSRLYLEKIQWVFDKEGKALYRAELHYEERPDPISDCKPGFDVETTLRVKELWLYSEQTRTRTFRFTYDASAGLSRLLHVTRFGIDPNKSYPVAFSMKYSDAVYSEKTARMVTMPTSASQNFKAGNSDFVDINGDGLPDIINTSNPIHRFHLNVLKLGTDGKQNSHDFPTPSIVDNPAQISAKLSNPSVQMLDVNGDGFTDMVDAVNMKIYLNKGNSKWEDLSETLKAFPTGVGTDPNLRFMDYNGDKKIDIIRSTRENTTYWVNDGKGSWNQVNGEPIGASFSQDQLRLIDINGDGLQDAVQIISGKLRYKKYYGYGKWSDWIDINVPGLENRNLGNQPQFRDINGDGLADMVAFIGSSIVYFVNKNGREFAAGQELQKFAGIDIPDSDAASIRIADINGNGSRDIVWIDASGKITYLELFSERPNLLKQISNGIGQRINIDYNSSVYHYLYDKDCDTSKNKGCAGPWKNKMPMAFTVVQRISTWASRSDKPAVQDEPTETERPQIQRIYYHHGFYDGMEKKFRGFRHVETLFEGDASVGTRKDEIRYDVGDSDVYRHGRLLTRIVSDGANHTYQKMEHKWADCPVSLGSVQADKLIPPVRFICSPVAEVTYIEGESAQQKWKVTRSESQYDGFGNVIVSAELGDIARSGDEKYTKKIFITPEKPNDTEQAWLPRAIAQARICDSPPEGNDRCAEFHYFYDGEAFKGLPLGQIGTGHLVRVKMRKTAGKDEWIEPMRYKYDPVGNPIEMQPMGSQKRSIEWDPVYRLFPTKETTITENVTFQTSAVWDLRFGAVIQSTDHHGNHIFYTYDTFGRLTSKSRPGDAPGQPSERFLYELQAPLSRIITESRSTMGGAFDRQQIQCFDGLGRKLQTRQMLKAGRFLVASHIDYNRLGMRAQVWNAYEADEACSFSAPATVAKTQFQYDGMGRLHQRTNPDQTIVKRIYQPLAVINYDEEDMRKGSPFFDTPTTTIYDGLQRTIQETEQTKEGNPKVTRFTYTSVNPKGEARPLTVSWDKGKKEHTYDLLGNVLEIQDPDRNKISFVYNLNNLLVSRTDARGKTAIITYDQLGRRKTLEDKDDPTSRITFTYDTPQEEFKEATYLQGRLARVQYPGGSYLFSYDSVGQLLVGRHVYLGVAFDFKSGYTHDRQEHSIQLPGGQTIEYRRDAANRVIAVPGIIKEISYCECGLLNAWEASNGIRTSYTFNLRNWPTSIDAGEGKVFRMEYTFDGVSNPLTWKQQHGDQVFSNQYQYDSLYRLTHANLGATGEILTYTHDQLHNLRTRTSSRGAASKVHLGTLTYDAARPHQVKEAGSIKIKYDDAGHVLQRHDIAWRWDYMGRSLEAKRGTQAISRYWYSHNNNPILQENDGHHIYYINDSYEIRDGVGHSYVRINDNRVAALRSHDIAATFFDDLAPATGSISLTSTPDGKINAGDAWLYFAQRHKLLQIATKRRTIDIDMTKDMLRAGLSRLLEGDKPQTLFYHADHLGSIRAVTGDQGVVQTRQHYYPFGTIRTQTGQQTSYGFMGSEHNPRTNTHRFYARSLDPTLGRWLSPDPAFHQITGTRDEFNSYGMVLNNPIRMREYDGTTSADTSDNADIMGSAIIAAGAIFSLVGTIHLARRYMASKKVANVSDREKKKAKLKLKDAQSAAAIGIFAAAMIAQQFSEDPNVGKWIMMASFVNTTLQQLVSLRQVWSNHRKIKKHGEKKGQANLSLAGQTSSTIASGLAAAAFALDADPTLTLTLSAVSSVVSIASTMLSKHTVKHDSRFNLNRGMGKLDQTKKPSIMSKIFRRIRRR